MKVRHFWDDILGQPSRVSLLRVLAQAEKPETGRRLAARSGLSPRAGHQTLHRMVQLGLVRQVPSGKAFLFSLERQHPTVAKALLPLFEYERAEEGNVLEDLIRDLKGDALTVLVFGSTGTGNETAGSDLDVLCIVPDRAAVRRVEQARDAMSARFRERHRKLLSLHVLTPGEVRERLRKGNDYVRSAVREGRLLWGKPVTEVMDRG